MATNKLKNFKIVLGYKSIIALAFFLAGVGTTLAFASIPDSSGVISTCYRNTLLQKTFRVIDSEAGQICNGNETALNFNQTGPQGPQGPQGQSGNMKNFSFYLTRAQVPLVEGSTSATATATCNEFGDTAIGGGYQFNGSHSGPALYPPKNISVTVNGNGSATYRQAPTNIYKWDVAMDFDPWDSHFYGASLVVTATCVHVE